MANYAKGKDAWGICARSGRRMKLIDMVPDGDKPGLMVDPAYRDIKHPVEKPMNLADAVALRRPAPDVDDDSDGDSGTTLEQELFPDGLYFGTQDDEGFDDGSMFDDELGFE